MHRRDFLRDSAAALAVLPWTGRLAPPTELRLGTCRGTTEDEEAGLAFGAAEAHRTASMFGWSVRREPLEGRSDSRGVHAIVATAPAPAPDAIPYMSLHCDDRPDGAFALLNCDQGPGHAAERTVAWHHGLVRFGAAQLNDRYRAHAGREMSEVAWAAWFAFKILTEAAMRARSTETAAITAHLLAPTTKFDGHKGRPLHFDASRTLVQPLYVVGADGRVLREREP